MIRHIALLAALLAAGTVGGCEVYEPYAPPMAYAAPGYYAPPAVYAAPVVVAPSWGGGYRGRYHGRPWR